MLQLGLQLITINYVTPKMTVFDPLTHPVTLGNVSLDTPTVD